MKAFIRGMGSIRLFPEQKTLSETSVEAAWREVGQAFQAVGDSIRKAINEQKQSS